MTRRATNGSDGSKRLVLDAFAEFARGHHEVLRSVLHEDFVEHSPGNPSGRDAFAAHAAAMPVARADLDLRRVVAEDDLVVLHYRLTPHDGGPALAVVDIWRVADDLIVEHWDVVQPVPDPSDTPHGML
jgi:predicted SnoaL-like aldol condensation-catalyzing enzyme